MDPNLRELKFPVESKTLDIVDHKGHNRTPGVHAPEQAASPPRGHSAQQNRNLCFFYVYGPGSTTMMANREKL